MKFIAERSFEKSSKNLPKNVQLSILKFIKEIEAVTVITELRNIKKLTSDKNDPQNYYRYKTGNYRLGFILETDALIRLVIASHRKEIYNKLHLIIGLNLDLQ
ncbi:MAG: type II toxin-antitoxin system RelE/ParE family toxin [Sphingobacteriaceae bacterium]|nr:MAG: type II toxin-antitoxin system RelE/ParE family toxin [Sphingobacteriaceae bacterium]